MGSRRPELLLTLPRKRRRRTIRTTIVETVELQLDAETAGRLYAEMVEGFEAAGLLDA